MNKDEEKTKYGSKEITTRHTLKMLEVEIRYPPLIEIEYPRNSFETGDMLKFASDCRKKSKEELIQMWLHGGYKGEEIKIILRELQVRKHKIDRKIYL